MITLHNIKGISRKSGHDTDANLWTEFYVDYLAEQEDGECVECGDIIDMGWMCLDGGDEYCLNHVEFCDTAGECSDCERLEEMEIVAQCIGQELEVTVKTE